MNQITVRTSSKTYDIFVGRGLRNDLLTYLNPIVKSKNVFVITDSNVFPLYFEEIRSVLQEGGYQVFHTILPAGEEHKNMQTVLSIYEKMATAKIRRSDLVIALGGGVVGDIAGFCAASYMRGIPFIQIPTTLLAQVDSSIGGKTGVDLSAGKNLVGAFWQPSLVVIDIDTLKTLPQIQIKSGLAEIIKSAFIADKALFQKLKDSDHFERDVERFILSALQVKRHIVEIDEFEKNERMLLNFGHTLAHSIEKYHNFTGITHGEAVAIGMYCMQRAYEKKRKLQQVSDDIRELLIKYEIPYQLKHENLDELLEYTKNDKKSTDSGIHLVVIEETGKGVILTMDYPSIFEMIKGAADEICV
jgi:3-dehydroquinate synthase